MNLAAFEQRTIPEPNSGCLIWLGPKLVRGGYGNFVCEGVQRRAHRASWELHNGAIPKGLNVLHKCDTPLCVNPGHLFLGTHLDNGTDMRRKGRSNAGAKHWKFKTGKFVGRYARRSDTQARRNRSNDHLL